ncbi:hypothetical protein MTO96_034081 [Rhipicephalus appendiculatus]
MPPARSFAMLREVHYCVRILPSTSNRVIARRMSSFASNGDESGATELDEDRKFRKLDLYKPKEAPKQKRAEIKFDVPQPRSERMPVDQDWTSVWPTAQSFRPSVVPLPLRQGYREKGGTTGQVCQPGAHEGAQLPPPDACSPRQARQGSPALCRLSFCTPWPAGLETDEKCEEHFPVEVIDSDYCHASPSIRDPRSRIVTLRVKLSDLELDYHARDKLLRLVGDRYDPATDVLTIVTDRCPLKKQNYDYAHYLLTAVYHESWKTEPWEADKAESDMECYLWEKSRSEANAVGFFKRMQQSLAGQHLPRDCTDDDVKGVIQVKDYAEAVCEIHNAGESQQSWDKYKRSVCSLLGLKHSELSPQAGEVHAS